MERKDRDGNEVTEEDTLVELVQSCSSVDGVIWLCKTIPDGVSVFSFCLPTPEENPQ